MIEVNKIKSTMISIVCGRDRSGIQCSYSRLRQGVVTAECITKTKHDYAKATMDVLDTNGKPVKPPKIKAWSEGKILSL